MVFERLDINTVLTTRERLKVAGISPTAILPTSLEGLEENSKFRPRSTIRVSDPLTCDESTTENGATSDSGDETGDDHAGDEESSGYSGEEEGSESRALQKIELEDTESAISTSRDAPRQLGFPEIREDESTSESPRALDTPNEFESETKRDKFDDGFHRFGDQAARLPYFHASALGTWHAVVAYDACVRLCLNAWARGCMEAPEFLDNECALLREAFRVKQSLLQSEEELMANQSTPRSNDEISNAKPKKGLGKMKVQVRKVKMNPSPSVSSAQFSSKPIIPGFSLNGLKKFHIKESFSRQISGLIKTGVTSLRNSASSYEGNQDSLYLCILKLKSFSDQEAVKLHPGSTDTHIFFPEIISDELVIDVTDSHGKNYGRVTAQVASFVDGAAEKTRWLPIYSEPEHLIVGKLHLSVTYYTSSEDSNTKCGSVSETVAYDCVLEVAMKMQRFQQRNLFVHGSWEWILSEFASYYGVSNVYTKLRYLTYVMDVATPTSDCLTLVYDLLAPVMPKSRSRQENRLLNEAKGQIEDLIRTVFENYMSLDESVLYGINESRIFSVTDPPAALEPAVKLFTLLNDVSSPVIQNNLTSYIQSAVKKRCRHHLAEAHECINTINNTNAAQAYTKMATVCSNVKDEIRRDFGIRNAFPSFINLPNLSSSIYSTELSAKLREFLLAYPPSGPSPAVTELIVATSDFQRDLSAWNVCHVRDGVDGKELFHLYIMVWIQEKRSSLLESCSKWRGVRPQHSTFSLVDDMYGRLDGFIIEYQTIICRWPEYILVLENAIADVERAVVEALVKHYAHVLAPLNLDANKKKFSWVYLCTEKSTTQYAVPDDLGVLLNTMKRMMDTVRPQMESQFKKRAPRTAIVGIAVPGDRLSEVTVMLRSKFRGYMEAISEKLANNTKLQNSTKMKRILQETKNATSENDVRKRMHPLNDMIIANINHLHGVFESHVFVTICRGYWNLLGEHVLQSLGNRKERKSLRKASLLAVSILDDTFQSQMKILLGNDHHIEPPSSSAEVRSILCT